MNRARTEFAQPRRQGGIVLRRQQRRSQDQIRNVTLESIATPPYTASVDFDRVNYTAGTRRERRRETAVARITFVLRDQIPNAVIPVNPLGLAITHVRVDQAFR